jgi:hypothetical protein
MSGWEVSSIFDAARGIESLPDAEGSRRGVVL